MKSSDTPAPRIPSPYLLNRHLCASARSVSVTPVQEQWFKDWGQLLGDCLLDDAVYDRWDSQLSYTAVRFWDFLPPHRLRLVFAASDLVKKFLPVFPQPRQGVLHRHSVDARCSLVGLYPLVRPVQIISAQYALQQVCTVRFFGFSRSAPSASSVSRLSALRAPAYSSCSALSLCGQPSFPGYSAFFMLASFLRFFGLTIVRPFPHFLLR